MGGFELLSLRISLLHMIEFLNNLVTLYLYKWLKMKNKKRTLEDLRVNENLISRRRKMKTSPSTSNSNFEKVKGLL